ncbi:MAG: hypothetical protein AAF226_11700, partial [Verrucomicrobiota bacterium]
HLVSELSFVGGNSEGEVVLRDWSPFWTLMVGGRNKNDKGAYTFFDKVDERGYDEFPLTLSREAFGVEITENRLQVRISKIHGGSFRGEAGFTIFADSGLIKVEAIVSTDDENRAILYTAGVGCGARQVSKVAYHRAGREPTDIITEDVIRYKHSSKKVQLNHRQGIGRGGFDPSDSPLIGKIKDGILQAKYRVLALETKNGAVGIFPSPHKFLPPLDYAENVGFNFAWRKAGRLEAGVRQPPLGDGRYRPWVDCPAGSKQQLEFFLLLTDKSGGQAVEDVAKYTNHDRYPTLEGYKTFSSHYHMHHARKLIMAQRDARSNDIPEDFVNPMFVQRFKEVGMDIAHLAEFHGGPKTGLSRYEELQVLHRECARLSDDDILILPGEEPNVHLGGHWISFFPKPVYWDWPDKKSLSQRKKQLVNGEFPAFEREDADLGTIYFVQNAENMLRLAEKENALVWTAHPRIKSSTGYPDAYKKEDYYRSETFLGAAWKAMPANYANDRLGMRVLDLLDDMNQWGEHKQIIAEADLFSLNAASELYGHANINYLKLAKVPSYEDGWQPVLNSLRERKYFSGTGEVLIESLTFNGLEFPEYISKEDAQSVKVKASLKWSFPLSFVEIISGDGQTIFRDSVELTHTKEFGHAQVLEKSVDLSGRKWVRFEAWDVAQNGAFTQTVRIR